MTTLDIISLIDQNPITKLTDTYNNKLLTKIRDNFTEFEQQLFLTTSYAAINCINKNECIINVDTIWEWLGFANKNGAKRAIEKNFTIDTDYKILPMPKDDSQPQWGGHNKELILITLTTFKLLCLKIETDKADEIREYYIKLEEILTETAIEHTIELRNQLEQEMNKLQIQNEKLKKEYEKTLEEQKRIDRQNMLLHQFTPICSILYIIRVKSYENGSYIVKLGESRCGIMGRYAQHKTNYEEAILLDCFSVKRSLEFETYLKNHEKIKKHKVTDLPGHENEKELFFIGKGLTYAILLKTINDNIGKFDEKIEIALERANAQIELLTNLIDIKKQESTVASSISLQNAMHVADPIMSRVTEIEKKHTEILSTQQQILQTNREILEKLADKQVKTTTGFEQPLATLGPRLQKINPETKTIVKIYESATQCMNEDNKIKRPSLNKAVQENVIYNGYRWMFVDRELDPNVIHNMPDTVPTREQNLGYIAKLSGDKSQILNVYLDRKTAAITNGYCASGLDTAVLRGSASQGFYYGLYEKCEEELRDAFVARVGKDPLLYKDGVGKFDLQNNMVQEFTCKYDCIRGLKMSDKTLAKALDKNVSYNGFYFKSLGSKLSI